MHDMYAYYPVSGRQISEAADNTTGRLAAIDNLKGLLTATQRKAVDAVEGELVASLANSPTGTEATADDVTQKATFAAGALVLFATYVDTYDYDSSTPRSVAKLNAAYFQAEASDFGQPKLTYPTGTTPTEQTTIDTAWSMGYQAKRRTALKILNLEYALLGFNLDTDASHVSSVLNTGPTDATIKELYAAGALPGTAYLIWPDVDLSSIPIPGLPYDLRTLTPDQLADWVLSHPQAPKAVVDEAMKVPGVATSVGNKLADQATTVRSDTGSLDDFLAEYSRFDADPAVNAAMFTALGGQGTLTLLCAVSNSEHKTESGDQKKLLAMLKDGLESATGYPTFDGQTFAHELVDAGTTDLRDTDVSAASGFTGAMSYLLYDGTFGDSFISTVADDLDRYERVDNDGQPDLWAQRDNTFINGSYNWVTMFPDGARGAAQDPMIALMSALSSSPKADLSFFTGGGDSDGNGVPDRQQYYIGDRSWDSGGYYSLSRALDTATTNPSLLTDPATAQDSATLAAATVGLFTERQHFDDVIDELSATSGDDDAATHFAHILSTYMAGVDQAQQDDKTLTGPYDSGTVWSDDFHSDLTNVPIFSLDAVQRLSQAAMSTDDGLVELRHGLNTYEGLKLGASGDYLAAHPNDPDATSGLRTSVGHNASLEGMFMKELGDSKIAAAMGKDEAISGWIDMGRGVVDSIPVPGVGAIGNEVAENIVDLAISTGKDDGIDALKEHFAHFEADEIAKQNTDATTMLNQQEYSVAKTLFAHGLAADPQAIIADGSGVVTKEPDGTYQLMSYDDFSALPDADQQQALSEIYSSQHGVGTLFDRTQYEVDFMAEFQHYF